MLLEDRNVGESTRRTLIKQLAGSAAVTAFPILGQNAPHETHVGGPPVTKQAAAAYHYRYFQPGQLKTLDALTETIIPTDEHSPGAKAAGVSEYIDAIVADSSAETKRHWDEGIRLANWWSRNSYGKLFADCRIEEQNAIMNEFAGEERDTTSPEHAFFTTLKQATIDGYYTSKIGIHDDLQYVGNQALPEFPGCQHSEDH
jgi:gluconate 2-dehydrogenase gamma chain